MTDKMHEQIDALVQEIEDEIENNGTFNGEKHLALWMLDKKIASEVFEKGIERRVKFVLQ